MKNDKIEIEIECHKMSNSLSVEVINNTDSDTALKSLYFVDEVEKGDSFYTHPLSTEFIIEANSRISFKISGINELLSTFHKTDNSYFIAVDCKHGSFESPLIAI